MLKSVSIQPRTGHSKFARNSKRLRGSAGASSSITDILNLLLDDWSAKAKKLEDEEKARKTLYDNTSANLRQMIIDTKDAIDAAKIQLSPSLTRSIDK